MAKYWYYAQGRGKGGDDVFRRGRVEAPNQATARSRVKSKFGKKAESISITKKKKW